MEIRIEDYEYKAPSYEKVERPYKYVIDEEKEHASCRFYEKDGCWYGTEGPKDEISLLFAGDLLCQENMISAFSTKDGGYNFNYCFEFLRPLLKKADFVAGNLETPISDAAPYRGEIITHEGPFFCNAPVEYLAALKYAGFDMLTTANNHTLDAGAEGLYDTIINARKFGFIQTGTFIEKSDKFVVVDICGFKVGFTAFGTSYNLMQGNLTKQGRITLLNTYTENRAQTVFDEMKARGAEYTICFPHWGEEYTDVITERQREMAKALTRIGYDLVVGAHSHVVQRFELVNEKPVLFSLGNLISHINLSKKSMDSQYPVLMNLILKRNGEKIEPKIEFIPCRILKKVDQIPFAVMPVNENITFGTSIPSKLEGTEKDVMRLLICNDELINTSYPIDLDALNVLREFEDTYKMKIEELCPNQNVTASEQQAVEVNEPKGLKKLFLKADVENRTGKFKKTGSEMKLICLDNPASIVKINKDIDGIPVTAVENYRDGNQTARILYMGKFVRIVKKNAFSNFSRLESVRFYDATEIIEAEAFANCERLTGLILPKNLKEIHKRAFANCPRLMSIKIPNSVLKISSDAFTGSNKLTIYCEEGSFADQFAKKQNIPVKYMPL